MITLGTMGSSEHSSVDYGAVLAHLIEQLDAAARGTSSHSHEVQAPSRDASLSALMTLASHLQSRAIATERAVKLPKALPEAAWPRRLDAVMVAHLTKAGFLIRSPAGLEFLNQTVQEFLAAYALVDAAKGGVLKASELWPLNSWWQPNAWSLAAMRAHRVCVNLAQPVEPLIGWIAPANPGLASELWLLSDSPPLPQVTLDGLTRDWLPRMCDWKTEPSPLARAAIGLAMGRFDLDRRPGVGLRADGLPDIEWTPIDFATPHEIRTVSGPGPIPRLEMARYQVTNRQFQAFIDDGGYTDRRWWTGRRLLRSGPCTPGFTEPNCPRESLDFGEAEAFCRWLSSRLSERDGQAVKVCLPSNKIWEMAAMRLGSNPDSSDSYRLGTANCDETLIDFWGRDSQKGPRYFVGRTTPVGIYPVKSKHHILDSAGNVSEWVSDGHTEQSSYGPTEFAAGGAVRGGGWDYQPANMNVHKVFRGFSSSNIGFRVCRLVREVSKRA